MSQRTLLTSSKRNNWTNQNARSRLRPTMVWVNKQVFMKKLSDRKIKALQLSTKFVLSTCRKIRWTFSVILYNQRYMILCLIRSRSSVINQAIKQASKQSMNQPIIQWINRSFNQPISRPTNRLTNRTTNRSIHRSTNESIHQPIYLVLRHHNRFSFRSTSVCGISSNSRL